MECCSNWLDVFMAGASLFGLRASMPAASFLLLASTGPLDSVVRSPAGPPGSQGPGRCQVDRTALCDDSRGAKSGSSLPSFGLPCGSVLCSCSPSCSSTSTLRSPFCGGASGFALALLWQCPGRRLVRALALLRQRFDFTSVHGLVLCSGH